MSYQVLARKYRPKSFETLVGQEHVVRALSHALDQQRLHHAYLFTGTRGVGKTTLSRILAKAFNCEKGITAQPCGVCGACTAIDAGRFVDYIEMDAASNRGVDEMAALLEQAVYAPSNARFKVYMIDEVHMLTNHAFNSMLKTLEEPPEHVKFILATTDPQKIPVTVLSRCLQFNLKQMPPGHIVSHLENILGQEHIECDRPALRLLAHGAHGSMRDALSLTDQAIAYSAGRVTLEAVQSMLGALDQSYLLHLLDGLVSKDGKALLGVADEMAARSLSYKAALQDLATLLHQIAVAQMVPAALADDLPERVELMRFAELFGKDEIQLYYQIAVHGRNELGLAPDEYAGFSMTLLRMLAFRPSSGGAEHSVDGSGAKPEVRPALAKSTFEAGARAVSNVAATSMSPARTSISVAGLAPAKTLPSTQILTNPPVPEDIPRAGLSPAMAALAAARAGSNKAISSATAQKMGLPASTPNVHVASATVSASVIAPSLRVAPSAVVAGAVASDAAGMDDLPPPWDDYEDHASAATSTQEPESEPVLLEAAAMVSTVAPAVEIKTLVQPVPAPVVAVANVSPLLPMPVAELNWDGHWPKLAASLPLRGVAQQLVQQSELVSCEVNGNVAIFRLRVPLQTLLSSGSIEKLIAALAEHFQRNIRVETEIGAVEQTANAQAMTERAARQVRAENSVVNDSFVQTLIREFGASIVTGSIKPI